MKKVTLAAVVLAVLMLCGNAQAQASTPKSKAGEYAQHSAKYAEYIPNCRRAATTSPKLEDEAAKKVDAMSPIEFTKHVMACQMNEKAVSDKNATVGAQAVYRRSAPAYRSFDNVAAESHRVRSRGKDYNLRNIGGNTMACNPPRQLVRSERCGPTPNGRGVRCQFDCR